MTDLESLETIIKNFEDSLDERVENRKNYDNLLPIAKECEKTIMECIKKYYEKLTKKYAEMMPKESIVDSIEISPNIFEYNEKNRFIAPHIEIKYADTEMTNTIRIAIENKFVDIHFYTVIHTNVGKTAKEAISPVDKHFRITTIDDSLMEKIAKSFMVINLHKIKL